MSVSTLSMANISLDKMKILSTFNLVCFVQVEYFQRCSLVAVRYVAQAARSVSLPKGFGFYKDCTNLEIGRFL
jgi:hypothetical protein